MQEENPAVKEKASKQQQKNKKKKLPVCAPARQNTGLTPAQGKHTAGNKPSKAVMENNIGQPDKLKKQKQAPTAEGRSEDASKGFISLSKAQRV